MIGATRRRAETHSSSGQLHEGPDRSTFLGLPPHYGGLFLSTNNTPAAERSMVHASRGFMNCFFWCGQPEATYSDDGLEDSDDLASGVPDYLFGRRLGEGHQGEVRYAIRRSDGESVAVKCVKRNRHSAKEEERALEEATVLSRLSHSSIVRLLSFESRPSYHYLVLELLDGGELVDAVADLATYTENDARQIAIAVFSALRHAHDDGLCVHRDLRPEHLLIARDPSMASLRGIGRRVKVAGWGRSKRLPPSGLVPGEHCFVNRALSAPEMILEEPHGPAADMFAVGAILYTLLSGSPPRATTMSSAISPKAPNTSGPAWAGVSDEAKGLVHALMTPEGPAARLTAGEALEHGWIKAEKEVLRARSLDGVLKGIRVLSWRGALQSKNRARELGGSAQGGLPRAVSMF